MPRTTDVHLAKHSSKISFGECAGSAYTPSGHTAAQGMHFDVAYIVLAVALGCLFARNKSFRVIGGVVAALTAVNIGIRMMFAC